MEERTGLLFIMVLGAAWACDARELANPDLWMNDITKSEASGNSFSRRYPYLVFLLSCLTRQIEWRHVFIHRNKLKCSSLYLCYQFFQLYHNKCVIFRLEYNKCMILKK